MQTTGPTPRGRLRLACIATCPPRQCGIATFASDLAAAMRGVDPTLDLRFAAIDGAHHNATGADVGWRVRQGDPSSYRALAGLLNDARVDAVLLQHEFGLYGHWGPVFDDHLTEFLALLHPPLVSILHSVPPRPSESVRQAVRRLADRSASVVVMAEVAAGLLRERYGLDPAKVRVVLHGVPSPSQTPRADLRRALGVSGRPLITTFGFLDPHKGLEHMIAAMQALAGPFPDALYLIVGRTHPELARTAGEAYRSRLEQDVRARGLSSSVRFVDEYVTLERIVDYLAATDVYVTPYLDLDQVTSGTLAYALGQGRAVVSTPYVHAAEALADGRGVLVPPADPGALAQAVGDLLGRPAHRRAVEERASAYGARMAWPLVGAQILEIIERARAGAPAPPGAGSVTELGSSAGEGIGRRLGAIAAKTA